MAKKIYNEGRTAGYSAYETYVKQFLAINPNGTPASEREWLASSLAMGSSVVVTVPKTGMGEAVFINEPILPNGSKDIDLDTTKTLTGIGFVSLTDELLQNLILTPKGMTSPSYTALDIIENDNSAILRFVTAGGMTIRNDNTVSIAANRITIEYDIFGDDIYHYVDIPLPSGTSLCAANTIIGTWVDITPYETDDGIVGIKSYSDYLVPNNGAKLYPNSGEVDASDIPSNPIIHYDDPITNINQAYEYLKIVDGVVLQSGVWNRTGDEITSPYMMFSNPDFTKPPIVRLVVKGTIQNDFCILLTGFSDSGIISGVSGLDGAWDTSMPQNGDFLGPSVYPWANKIIFTNSSVVEYAITNQQTPMYIAVPEFMPDTYYYKSGDTYTLIETIPTDWDNRDTSTASNKSYINCYVKMDNRGYVRTLPIYGNDNVYYISKYNTNIMLLPRTSVSANPTNTLDHDDNTSFADGNGYLNWSQLLRAFAEDKKIRISPYLVDILNNQITWNSDNNTFELKSNTGLKTGKNYIDFNGVRLYISTTAPTDTDIPNGSIGIGW